MLPPQYGTEETRAYIELSEVERMLAQKGKIKNTSNIYEVLLVESIKSERWRKWMSDNQVDLTVEEIRSNKKLSKEILDIAGHYTFNNKGVKKEIEKLYSNLKQNRIDGQRFVIDHIKRPIRDYAEIFNLNGLTSRIKSVV